MLPHSRQAPRERTAVLEPAERTSEVLFGLIMVLTFTGSLSAAEAGRAEVRTMLLGAIGCNIAWGLIDAIMYLMACLSEKAERARMLLAVRGAPDAETAHRAITAVLPDVISSSMTPEDLARLRQVLSRVPEPDAHRSLGAEDWLGALGVFLWVVLSALPVVVPFLVVEDPTRALRASNAIAVFLLFVMGHYFGRDVGLHPMLTGAAMVLIGAALVALTMALGG